jgi:hypothetical protein
MGLTYTLLGLLERRSPEGPPFESRYTRAMTGRGETSSGLKRRDGRCDSTDGWWERLFY